MPPLPTTCSKCSGPMVHGFSIEFGTPPSPQVASWVEGEPELGWFGVAMKVPHKSTSIPIATLRCASCGYLESYARSEFAPK